MKNFRIHKRDGKFQAYCRNPFTKKNEHLGCLTCENQAHAVWRNRKHELALQNDTRVAEALRGRYL